MHSRTALGSSTVRSSFEQWLPATGTVLELASGTGEHALAFARRFAKLNWQPSDPDPLALGSIAAWITDGPDNLLAPLPIDAASPSWPVGRAEAVLCLKQGTWILVE